MLHLLLSLLLSVATLGQIAPPVMVDGLHIPSNQVFVMFREGTSEDDRNRFLRNNVSQMESVEHYSHIPHLSLVTLPKTMSSEEIGNIVFSLEALVNLNALQFVERDIFFTTVKPNQVIPNDSGFIQLWGHRNIGQSMPTAGLPGFDSKATFAWTINQGSESIRVLVIDTGVQLNHPDLNLEGEQDFTTGAVNGIPSSGQLNSCDNHGTAVAGVVSGKINNFIGTVGISPLSPVVSAKVGSANVPCNGAWSGQTSWTVNALNWAAANGIRVTNNSNSYGFFSNALNAAYSATRNLGVVHFASSGNNGTNSIAFPAAYTSVNAIGAANRFGQVASFSNYGTNLSLVAAGDTVYTTDRTGLAGYTTGNYAMVNGTSFSSPYVAGVAALILTKNPDLTPNQVRDILQSTARNMPQDGGFNQLAGWGMVNAYEALLATPSLETCQGDLNQDGIVDGADLGFLLAQWGNCSSDCSADLNGDGKVDGADLGLLLAVWGTCLD